MNIKELTMINKKKSKKKILIIGTLASSNFNFRLDLLKDLINRGYTVCVAGIDYTQSQINILNELKISVYNYSLNRSGLNPFLDLYSLIELYIIIKKIRPNIVLSYFSKPLVYGTLSAKIARIKHKLGLMEGLGFAFTYEPSTISFKKKIIKYIQIKLYKISLKYLNKLFYLNPDDLYELSVLHNIKSKNDILLGPIGVDIVNFNYIPPKKKVINFLFVGRLIKEKGIIEFLLAAKKTKNLFPQVEFTVIGDFDSNKSLIFNPEFINILNDINTILHIKSVNDIINWYAKSSVFVLPSYREGYPRSTQEAMSVGRAIITTDVPGCRETVEHGKNGLLISPYNSNALFDAFKWFILNPMSIELMGLESRRMAESKFNVRNINNNIINHIEELIV